MEATAPGQTSIDDIGDRTLEIVDVPLALVAAVNVELPLTDDEGGLLGVGSLDDLVLHRRPPFLRPALVVLQDQERFDEVGVGGVGEVDDLARARVDSGG
jgi:hypothetical protein